MGSRSERRKREEPACSASPFTDKSLAEFTSSGSDLRLRCKDGRVLPVHTTILQLASRNVLKEILEHSEPGAELKVGRAAGSLLRLVARVLVRLFVVWAKSAVGAQAVHPNVWMCSPLLAAEHLDDVLG